jgi:hypothetical protein
VVSGGVDGYHIYHKPTSATTYSSCPASAADTAAGKGCATLFSFTTDPSATASITISDLTAGTYDFIVKSIMNVAVEDFDPSIHESRSDCESCKASATVTATAPAPEAPAAAGGGGGAGSAISEPSNTPYLGEELHPAAEEEAETTEVATVVDPTFTDLVIPAPTESNPEATVDHWATDLITELATEGIVSGYPDGTFQPDASINRAELTKIALAAFPEASVETTTTTESETKSTWLDFFIKRAEAAEFTKVAAVKSNLNTVTKFSDVEEGSWYETFVNQAQIRGIVNGYSDGSFKPGQSITRAEALKILLESSGFKLDTNAKSQFGDVSREAWYTYFIAFAEKNGVVAGYPEVWFKGEMKLGDYGEDIKTLQRLLKKTGLYRGRETGYLGSVTQKAVIAFQNLHQKNLKKNELGIVDLKTIKKLVAAVGDTDSFRTLVFFPEREITRAETVKLTKIILDLRRTGYSRYAKKPSFAGYHPKVNLIENTSLEVVPIGKFTPTETAAPVEATPAETTHPASEVDQPKGILDRLKDFLKME